MVSILLVSFWVRRSKLCTMRFSLVDRIVQLEAGTSITAVKHLSLAEEYLQDHFPGFPVMPGVLMLESLVQAGAWLMRHTEEFKYSMVLLKQAKAVKFNKFLEPGNSITVNLTVHKKEGANWTLKAKSTIDNESAVSARLILEQFNLAERNPELQKSDEMRIAELKNQFSQIWSGNPAN